LLQKSIQTHDHRILLCVVIHRHFCQWWHIQRENSWKSKFLLLSYFLIPVTPQSSTNCWAAQRQCHAPPTYLDCRDSDYYQNQQTDNLAHLQKSFTKQGCKFSNNENFNLTLTHMRHIGSTWCKMSGTFTRQMFKPSTDFIWFYFSTQNFNLAYLLVCVCPVVIK
jgi:hypothetical protein